LAARRAEATIRRLETQRDSEGVKRLSAGDREADMKPWRFFVAGTAVIAMTLVSEAVMGLGGLE